VPIPAFEHDGLLPAGMAFDEFEGKPILRGHDCFKDEAEETLVVAFAESVTRPALWRQFENLLGVVEQHFKCFLVLLSGEFVTNLTDPDNIHIVFELPGEAIEAAAGEIQWQMDWLFNSREQTFGTDHELTVQTGLVRAFAPGSAKFDVGNAERMVERHIASSPRLDSIDGGYLEILRCEGGLANAHAIFDSPA
jgi:hypothetical protein